MSLTNVAIVGANGNLGPSILHALLTTTPPLNVTVITRESSKSSYTPRPNLTIQPVPDSLPHSSLVSALHSHDALVIAISGSATAISLKLIAAAHEAGVSRIIPADYGSCDSSDPRSLALLPLYNEKKKVRDHLISLAEPSAGKFSWTSIVCGHFLDYGLEYSLMQIFPAQRKARIFDGGETFFSATMLRTVGDAVVGILRNPGATRDRIVYVQSVRTTQNELLRVVQKVVGGDGGSFEVEKLDSEEFIRERKEAMQGNGEDYDEELVAVEGLVNADWTGREGFMREELGLRDERLEDLVRESLKK